jgi:hypothetical protein
MHTRFRLENLNIRDHLEDKGIDENIIMHLGEKGWEGVEWMPTMGSYEHSNGPSGFIKGGEFFD